MACSTSVSGLSSLLGAWLYLDEGLPVEASAFAAIVTILIGCEKGLLVGESVLKWVWPESQTRRNGPSRSSSAVENAQFVATARLRTCSSQSVNDDIR
jgi:hypothetical protein